jgi:LysM repeat protein
MASMKRGAVVASTLMLIAVIASACNQPYSTPPATPTSLFNTPIGQTPNITMSDVANFGTSTALAQTGTPLAVETQTLGPGVAPQDLSATATPVVSTNPASTSTLAIVGTQSGILSTSAPVGTRPAEYTLHSGEFPYCIARRFDVDPEALLALNGLSNGNIVYPGRTLKIPQSGSFPDTRAREPHPATYTVASSSETLYSIACRYGDVDPVALASANGLSSPDAPLTAGMQLKFP